MEFDPDSFEVKPIGDAGLTERTVLDGSERILVQGGPDENVDTTPMEFVKFETIQAKIDTLKGSGWTGETVKKNADDISTLKGTGWAGQTVKGNSEDIALKESIVNVNILKGTWWEGETVKGNAEDMATLNGDDSTEGSVAKSIKDAVDPIKGTGWAGETVKGNATAIASITATPPGIIVIWSGLISAIPAGWFLCNGSNGTPDLRGRFIYGASVNADVKTTGGSANAIVVSHTHTGPAHTHTSAAHTHSTPNHSHSASSNSTGAHTHTYPIGYSSSKTAFYTGHGTGAVSSNAATSSAGAHSHTITVNSGGASTTGSTTPGATGSSGTGNTGSTGSSGTNANLPPYMKLAYIMKG